MRPLSSQATATGETTIGSAATSSTLRPGSVFKYLSESLGLRGPSMAKQKKSGTRTRTRTKASFRDALNFTNKKSRKRKKKRRRKRETGISVLDLFEEFD